MTRTRLEQALGALFGAALGSVLAFVLVMTLTMWHWLLFTPIVLGAVLGWTHGDRGIYGLARAFRWLP